MIITRLKYVMNVRHAAVKCLKSFYSVSSAVAQCAFPLEMAFLPTLLVSSVVGEAEFTINNYYVGSILDPGVQHGGTTSTIHLRRHKCPMQNKNSGTSTSQSHCLKQRLQEVLWSCHHDADSEDPTECFLAWRQQKESEKQHEQPSQQHILGELGNDANCRSHRPA